MCLKNISLEFICLPLKIIILRKLEEPQFTIICVDWDLNNQIMIKDLIYHHVKQVLLLITDFLELNIYCIILIETFIVL